MQRGTIVQSDSFPNQVLENAGFQIYASNDETVTDFSGETINYCEWSLLGNSHSTSLIEEHITNLSFTCKYNYL